MDYETVIGLEVHAQLLTRSKMFCACSAEYQDTPPNTHVCPVCLGMPGVLPVINRRAVEYTVMTGLALHCSVNLYSKFDRKNYPYPDLMKGYQISQYDQPLCINGWLMIDVDGETRKAGITRVHLEEDTAKLTHRNSGHETYSLVDVNRSGVPLMEVVGEPDLRSPEEARQYLIALRRILQYLGVSTGNMEEGSFRCDANVSLRPVGSEALGNKVEVKNMNSFRAVYRALEFEVVRQAKLLDAGERIPQETRGWVEDSGQTVSQRSKEYAHDYRYFPEPDLPPLAFTPEWVEGLRVKLPELPEAKRDRFMQEYGLPQYDADLLTSTRAMAEFFEAVLQAWNLRPTISGQLSGPNPPVKPDPGRTSMLGSPSKQNRAKHVSNWLLGEFTRLMNVHELEVEEATKRIRPDDLAELLEMVLLSEVGGTSAKSVFEEMLTTGRRPREIVEQQGLAQISGADELASLVDKVIANNPQAVEDYRSGKQQAVGFLVGQVMKESRGRANPGTVTALLKEKLGS